MRTAAEVLPTRYVQTGTGATPEPRFRRSWSNLRKLQWQASLIMSEHPGVRLFVMKGKSWTNGRFNYGLFQLSYNRGGFTAACYESVSDILMGISVGLDIADQLGERR